MGKSDGLCPGTALTAHHYWVRKGHWFWRHVKCLRCGAKRFA